MRSTSEVNLFAEEANSFTSPPFSLTRSRCHSIKDWDVPQERNERCMKRLAVLAGDRRDLRKCTVEVRFVEDSLTNLPEKSRVWLPLELDLLDKIC
jgi:hypothetical protein